MKSVFLFLCFVIFALTSPGRDFPRLDLSLNGPVIRLDGHEDRFLMHACVEAGLQDYYVSLPGSAEIYRNTTVSYSPDHSYTVARTYLTSSGATWRESVRYVDGLGRPLQDVQVGASPDGISDLIQPYVYGRGGRVEKSFLPYPGSGNLGNFDAGFSAASNWALYGTSEQSYAFSMTEYDGSPSNRVTKQTGPGSAWHAAGKGVTTAYGYNGADEVRLYRVSSDGDLVRSGYYAAGRLEKTTVTDEDGLVTESFTDNEGKTVLTVSLNGSDRLETYTVYDALGRVRWVLSPEASHRLGAGTDATILNRYAYRYDYDPRGRLIEKRLPGVDPVYYVYDGKDRMVLSQDGNQRSGNRWSYTLYDGQNRAIETGDVVLTGKTAVQLRSEAGASRNYLPSGTRTALQYCLYDSYMASATVTPHAFVATSGYATTYHSLVTGQLTATKTRILGSDTWQTTTLYYDDLGRIIQTVSDNRLGGLSRSDMQYDFVGNLLQQRESHGKTGGSADVLESVNTYDMQGRLLTQSVSLNGGVAATLTYSYDALGRLTGKRYGNLNESMTYNIRGWLTGKESTPFRMQLRYETPVGGSAARWSGSLSEWEWQHGTNAAMMYGLTYDGLNRFTGAVQKQKSDTSWSVLGSDYVERGLTYDRNGNLLTLQRTAGGNMVDNLAYTYTGNLLTGLSESVRTAQSNDIYAPGSAASGSYGYDANGNLQNDSRRALLFDYNFLNLVSEVRTGGTVTAAYTWLADGTKLGVRNGSGSDGFEYVGSLIYRKSGGGLQLSEALFGDGVIRLNDNGTQEVEYFLTDHLGSVRVIVDASGTVKERNDYYPFGARHIRSDYAQSTNRWKYNGKELQTTGELGYLDYGARMYDTGLGRWFCADPAGESAPSLSLYRFGLNNPLMYTDYCGLWEYSFQNGNWYTDDKNDISRFLSMLDYEMGIYKDVSTAQLDKFIHEEYSGRGGRLSDGSLLLDEISAYRTRGGDWQIPVWQQKEMWKQIHTLGSNPLNWNNMVSSGSYYTYQYYREKQWEVTGGSFPGIALGSYVAGVASDVLYNGKTWYDFVNMKSYKHGYYGNQMRSGKSVKQAKGVARAMSRGADLLGKGLGVYGAINTTEEYLDRKLTPYGVGYIGASDAVGIVGGLGSAWSFGTSIGKWIVESNWYFKLVHNNRTW